MNENVKVIFGLVGGLAIFLFIKKYRLITKAIIPMQLSK